MSVGVWVEAGWMEEEEVEIEVAVVRWRVGVMVGLARKSCSGSPG